MLTYDHISKNKTESWILIFSFLAIISVLGFVFSQAYNAPEILYFAVGFSVFTSFISYYFSDSITLALSRAKEVDRQSNPDLYRLVENLCIAAGLPTPKIYIIDDTAPNAFATGRDPKHAAIAFTTGILSKLYRLELEGVTAHELSHVGNYDTRLMTIVSILVGTVALLADFFFRLTFYSRRERDRNSGNGIFLALGLVMAILAPIVAMLIQLAISRKREFLADASGALLTRNPDGLADALLKIAADKEPLEVANKATAHLYIVNPLKNHKDAVGWFAGLFQTHPPIQERVKALRAMQ